MKLVIEKSFSQFLSRQLLHSKPQIQNQKQMVNPIIKQQQDKSATNFSGKPIVRTNDSNQGNSLLNLTGMCFSHFPLDFNKSKLLVIFNLTTNTHSAWILRSFQGCNEARLSRIMVFQDYQKHNLEKRAQLQFKPNLNSTLHSSQFRPQYTKFLFHS